MKRMLRSLAVCGALAASASPALAQNPVEWINAVRTDIGAPTLDIDATATAGCQAHADYMARNRSLTHVQTPGAPGYTALGAEWGMRGNLSTEQGEWFRTDPYHLARLLSPYNLRMGYGGTAASPTLTYWCIARTYDTRTSSPWGQDDLLVWPRPGSTVAPDFRSNEVPTSPIEDVGLPADAVTGPHMILFPVGPARERERGYGAGRGYAQCVRVTSVRMWGPSGDVEVRAIDSNRNSTNQTCMSGAAFLVPITPLQPQSQYTVRVTLSQTPSGGNEPTVSITKEWTYRTGDASILCGPLLPACETTVPPTTPDPTTQPAPRPAALSQVRVVRRNGTLRVSARASHRGQVTVRIVRPTRPKAAVRLVRKAAPRANALVRATATVPSGRLRVTLTLAAANGTTARVSRTI